MIGIFILCEVLVLQIILGVSNVWFITFLGEKLPLHHKEKARVVGLIFAWAVRLLVIILYPIVLESHFTIDTFSGFRFYWMDVLLLTGGTFILLKSVSVIFNIPKARYAYANVNLVLLQGFFISAFLSVDAVRVASYYVENKWLVAGLVLVSMFASSKMSDRIILWLRLGDKGPVLLLVSTGLVLILEAFHQPLLSELICFAAALYVTNSFIIPRYRKSRLDNKIMSMPDSRQQDVRLKFKPKIKEQESNNRVL